MYCRSDIMSVLYIMELNILMPSKILFGLCNTRKECHFNILFQAYKLRPSLCLFPSYYRCLHSSSQFRGQLYPTDDELYSKTSVSLLSKESTEVPYISKYSARGFTISGDVIVGPVAILPWSLVHWNVST